MRQRMRAVHVLMMVGSLASAVTLAGCFLHHNSSSPWQSVEESHYVKWEKNTHRTHKQYDLRSDDEQKEYWVWRETHS